MAAVQDEAQARGVVVNAPYDEAPSEQLCPGVPDVSDSGRLGRLDLLEPLPPPTFSNSRPPPPSRIGTTETTISSSRPAERYCCATDAPPPRDTSFSPAAARACSSADSIPSVTKWNVVPPCISSGSRGWLVRTKTGWWKGGLSPHQPFHDSSHGPGPPPNMFRPMMVAPGAAEDVRGERRARVPPAPFLAVALAERFERDQPVVELLTADPERMLWRLVRAGDEAVDRHRDVQLQLAHRSSLLFPQLGQASGV